MSLGEDTIFNYDVFKYCTKIYCDKDIYYHYRRGNSKSLFSRFTPNIYSIHTFVLNNKIRVLRMLGATESVLCELDKNRLDNIVITAIHYYQNKRFNTHQQRVSILKFLSEELSNMKFSFLGLTNKYMLIIFLLKAKCFWLLNLILSIKY